MTSLLLITCSRGSGLTRRADYAADFTISDQSDLNPVRMFLKRAVCVAMLQRLSHGALLKTYSFAHAHSIKNIKTEVQKGNNWTMVLAIPWY